MKCQFCNEQVATIHLTEIEDGQKKEVHLCEDCYKDKNTVVEKSASLDSLIKTLLSNLDDQTVDRSRACPICGTTYTDFQKRGLLGCPEDYTVFKDSIGPLLEKVQGAEATHKGKVPRSFLGQRSHAEKLIVLRKELDEVIKNEMFEKAAELRDEIKRLERQEV
jgi:protein arginine kinase activator